MQAILGSAAEAAKAAIGPKVVAEDSARAVLAKTREALKELKKRKKPPADLQHISRLESTIVTLEQEVQKAADDLIAAKAVYNNSIRSEITPSVAAGVAKAAAKFEACEENAHPATLADIVTVCEALGNVGVLERGDKVKIDVGGFEGFVPAVVDGRGPGPDEYKVLAMRENLTLGSKYEQVYDVPHVLPRSKLYAEDARICQPASPADAAGGIAALMDSLWEQAEAAIPEMTRLIEEALAAGKAAGLGPRPAGIRVVVGPLKARTRALAKIFEKYGGDVLRLLDIARLTVVCDTEEGVAWALRAFKAAGLDFCRIKNRMHPSFRAVEETGGYRVGSFGLIVMLTWTHLCVCKGAFVSSSFPRCDHLRYL